MKSAAILTASILAALTVTVAFSLMSFYVPVHSVGQIKTVGVGVYWDINCTKRATGIDLGLLEPGQNKSVIVYVRNESNVPVSLSLSTANWNPVNASNYITLTWSHEGQFLKQGDVVKVTLTLLVSDQIEGVDAFSFDIIIAGSG